MKEFLMTMRRAISISMIFLMLIALLHLSVASHFCDGNIVSSKISLSGKPASCGMESDEQDSPRSGIWFTSHCCDNVLTFIGTSNNYFPSISVVTEVHQQHFQVFTIPEGLNPYSFEPSKSINTSVGPPGAPVPNSVDLSALCIYRI